MGNSSKPHGIHGIFPMKSYQIQWKSYQNLKGFMGFIFHFKSCVSYTIANQTGFRGSLLPGCLAHHAGKKGLAFTARALLSLGLSQSIANRAGSRASLWLEESILTYAPFAPSSPHPVVFCCWTFWKGASCVCTTLPLTDVLERGWARSSTHHGAKRPLRESSPRPLHFSLTL